LPSPSPPFSIGSASVIPSAVESPRHLPVNRDRHWRDVLAIIRTQGQHLDLAYLHANAARVEVTDELERALAEARR
jgi:hypothetical protein